MDILKIAFKYAPEETAKTMAQIYKEDSAISLLQLGKIKPKAQIGLNKILNLFNKWRLDLKEKKHYELMEIILDESGYSKMLKDKKDEQGNVIMEGSVSEIEHININI